MDKEIKWMDEVLKRKAEILHDTQEFLGIKSVLDEENSRVDAPFGEGIAEALQYMLDKGEQDGFIVKNLDGLAGHIQFGEGEELLGILCHVDVVPEGDGWSSHPFSAENRDGKIFARGAIDDKGPTIAAYYALKIVKELGLSIHKRVRIILGTDEESNWRCVDHYFKHEEMPTIGFTPDADFPIIYAEKGIFDFSLRQIPEKEDSVSRYVLTSFEAGRRLNMVPDFAKASLMYDASDVKILQENFERFLKTHNVVGNSFVHTNSIQFQIEGESAHGMEPNNGNNAGLLLIEFFHDHLENVMDSQGRAFVSFVFQYFGQDTRGKALGIAFEDDISGELTLNLGTCTYQQKQGGTIGINLRYPVTHKIKDSKMTIKKIAASNHFEFEELNHLEPHHVDEQHPLIQILQKVYEEQTGEKAELLAIGGGTYARSLESGVAFGPLFPGRPDVAHQKDEYIEIEDLLKATAIYAQAIYELTK